MSIFAGIQMESPASNPRNTSRRWPLALGLSLLIMQSGCNLTDSPDPFDPPEAFFRIDGQLVASADTVLRIGDSLRIQAQTCEPLPGCAYNWKLTGPDTVLDAYRDSALFLARAMGSHLVVHYVSMGMGDKEIASAPIYYKVYVAGARSAMLRAVPGRDTLIRLGDTLVLDASGSHDANDREAVLSYTWLPAFPQDSGIPALAGVSKPVFTPTQAGTFRYWLVVSNRGDSSEPALITIQVADENRAPVAKVADGKRVLSLGDSLRLDAGPSFDPDSGRIVRYAWTPSRNNPDTSLRLGDSAAPIFKPTKPGLYSFFCHVVDDRGKWSAPEVVAILALDSAPAPRNRPPIADAGDDAKYLLGTTVFLDAGGSRDPDGSALTYVWRQAKSNPDLSLMLDSVKTPVFQPTVPGLYTFILHVHDGENFSEPDQVLVEVAQPDWQVSASRTGPSVVRTLAEAMDSASVGDTIYLEPGTHQVLADVSVKRGVYLYGIDRDRTILDLGCRLSPVHAGNVLHIQGVTGVKLEGFTVRNGGRAGESEVDPVVAGISIHDASSVQLRNVTSEKNCHDGLRLIRSNNLLVADSRIRDNDANGIRSTTSAFDLVGSVVEGNGSAGSEYGGIAVEGEITVINLQRDTLRDNLPNQIKLTNGSTLDIGQTFLGGTGGGIFTTQGASAKVRLTDCRLAANSGSGVFCWDGGEFLIRRTTFDKAGLADSNKALDMIGCRGGVEESSFAGYTKALVLSGADMRVAQNVFTGNTLDIQVNGGNPPCPAAEGNIWPGGKPTLDYAGTSCPVPSSP